MVSSMMSLPSPPLSPKKRKHVEIAEEGIISSHKKAKKEKKSRGKKKADGQFQVVSASVQVSIPPRFSLDPLSGAKEMLDSLVMKYVPVLQGVMLCHSNARFASNTARLINECPFLVCTVNFDATVWSPQIGMKLTGKINLCSPDHISLLIHRTFNVSIPREHIPTENWVFEYGPAENDPEFGPHAVGSETKDSITDTNKVTLPITEPGEQDEPHGFWVHRITSDRLGGKDGVLEFTVIGMTIANQMLSLKASLQPDPFSPRHVPQPAVPPAQLDIDRDDEDERDEVDKLITQTEPDTGVEGSDEEEDPFTFLTQRRDEAMEREAADKEREKDQKAREKEEKKRRKRERKEKERAVDGSNAPNQPTKEEKPPKKKRKKEDKEA